MRTLFLLFFISAIVSCKKETTTDTTPPPPPPAPDSLGVGWSKVSIVASGGYINDVYFSDMLRGYAATTNGLFKSIDGGKTFNKISNKVLNNLGINNTGKLIGTGESDKSAYYLNTTDSLIKTVFSPANGSADMFDCFYAGNTSYYTSKGMIYKSTDGGVSAGLIYNASSLDTFYNPIFCLNENKLFSVSLKYFHKSVNGGAVWISSDISALDAKNRKTAVQFLNDVTGYISSDGMLYKTSDGGQTFSKIFSHTSPEFLDFNFINELTGYISHSSVIYKTTDGGITWLPQVKTGTAVYERFLEIHFTDDKHGWAGTEKGNIFRFEM